MPARRSRRNELLLLRLWPHAVLDATQGGGAHGGEEVIWAEWAPQPHAMDGGGEAEVLATAGADKKAKLWRSPR